MILLATQALDDIKEICNENNIPLLEDAACAIGSELNNKKIGNFSDITCFSFHPRKLLNTGEGGAISTNSDEYSGFKNKACRRSFREKK